MAELNASQKEALENFISGADKLEAAISGLSDKELDYAVTPGEWTIRQTIHHLATDGDAWSMPYRTAIAKPGTAIRFGGYPENEEMADGLAWDECPVETAVSHIKSQRKMFAELAGNFPDAWERCVKISVPEGQEMPQLSVGQIIGMFIEHLDEHLANIEAIKRRIKSLE